MNKDRFEEMKSWIIKRGRNWTLAIEDDKIRIMTNLFIMDMAIMRDIEQQLKFEITDVMSHDKYGVVLLCKDTVKTTGV